MAGPNDSLGTQAYNPADARLRGPRQGVVPNRAFPLGWERRGISKLASSAVSVKQEPNSTHPPEAHRRQPQAPTPLSVDSDAIDAFMAPLLQYRQFVCWDYEHRAERKKPWTKVPKDPGDGENASVSDPSTWGSFEDALTAMQIRRHDGIGFVLTNEDPFAVVDIDDVRDDAGLLADWAADILAELPPTFVEASASGNGLHIWTKGKLPAGRRRTRGIEVYDSGRFIAITGAKWPDRHGSIEECGVELAALHARLFPAKTPHDSAAIDHPSPPLTDEELLDHATAAKNGSKFHRLFSVGDLSDHGGDRSAGDLGLCCEVAFWSRDRDQIERIWQKSALWRDDKPGIRPDYIERTIDAALRFTTGHYDPSASAGGLVGYDDFDEPLPNQFGTVAEVKAIPSEAGAAPCRARIAELEAEVAHWKDVAHRQGRTLAGIRKAGANIGLDPRRRLVAIETVFMLRERERDGKTDTDGWTFMPRETVAKRLGVGPKVVSDTYDILHAAGVVEKSTVPTRDGRHLVTRLNLLMPLPDALCAIAAIQGHQSHQGGARVPISCPNCGSEAKLILARRIVCTRCGTAVLTLPDAPLPPAFQFDPVADCAVGTSAGVGPSAATDTDLPPCVYLPSQFGAVAAPP